ncbi:hypothetical protein ABEB36_009335 [Hypothenemus hampei]|uniref:Uncharacterized protein n=1 Tax=Hypothenemus hampei TaxID=57062 RepID=A0ABD1EGI2_HYPHA
MNLRQCTCGMRLMGAAVLEMLLKRHASAYRYINLYSVSCGRQNRSINMALLLLRLCSDKNMAVEEIELRFMTSGHSYLPNDSDFGIIEKAKKKDVNGSSVTWLKIQTMKFKRDHPFSLFIRESASENLEFREIFLEKKTVGRRN